MTETPQAQSRTGPSEDIWAPALKEAAVAFVTAVLLLIIFYVAAFRWIHPEFVPFMDREAGKLIIPGKDLVPISVEGFRVEGNSAIIEKFNDDEAILALPRAFQAEDYPFIKVNLKGFTRYSKFKILWRKAENLTLSHALEVNRSTDEATQIAMVYGHEAYREKIADIALLFYDGPALAVSNNDGRIIEVENIEFLPFTAARVAEQIYIDWVNPPLWSGHSSNIVRGVHANALLMPNAVTTSIIGLALVLVGARRRLLFMRFPKRREVHLMGTLLSICLYGWIINESLRWNWRLEQFADSTARYGGQQLEQSIRNNPIRCSRFPADCKTDLLPYF